MDFTDGIAVSNRFMSMPDPDEDSRAFIKKEKAQRWKKKDHEGDGKQHTVQKKEEKEHVNTSKSERSERGGGERGRGARREPREIRENDGDRKPVGRRPPPKDFKENKAGDENVPPEFRARPEGSSGGNSGFNRDNVERGRGRGRPRGTGGFRGSRGERGGRGGFNREGGEPRPERQGFGTPSDPGPRRTFDRHSGSDKTGIKAVEKKDGGGARNWGSYKDDLVGERSENPDKSHTEEGTENTELNESGEGEAVEQVKQMSLDEWKALQQSERTKPQFKLRKAGEGEDASQWSTSTAITNKKSRHEEETETEVPAEEADVNEDDKRHAHKNFLDIKITFNDPVRRGGRGGRRPRGDARGRGRGGWRGERKTRESAPKMDDENDFPRLVKTEA